MFPLRARDGGVLVRAGQTEAAVDLARIAGLYPAGVICEIMNEDGTMARVPRAGEVREEARAADDHDRGSDQVPHADRVAGEARRVGASCRPSTATSACTRSRTSSTSRRTSRWCCGDIGDGKDVLVRVHSQCLTGDVLPLGRAATAARSSMPRWQRIAAEGRGVLLYLNQEGRGIGLANKIRAYELQDEGFDTVEANERLGFKADQRDYGIGVQILRELGVRSMRLLSNNPRKLVGIEGYGLSVSEWLPLEIPASDSTRRYLKTKKEKLGHKLSSCLDCLARSASGARLRLRRCSPDLDDRAHVR